MQPSGRKTADDAEPAPPRPPDGEGGNRTRDTTIFSRVLYQLSYLAWALSGATRLDDQQLQQDSDQATAEHHIDDRQLSMPAV